MTSATDTSTDPSTLTKPSLGGPNPPFGARPGASFFRSPLGAAIAIFLLTFLAHGNSLFDSFIWDDDMYVFENPTLLDFKGLHDIWLVPSATPQYYPLVHTTFWIEHALWGFWPMGFHFDNILLHAMSSILLWMLLKRLRVPGAWVAAAIFAVHPVHVETVAWVTERKNTLSMLFYLASFYAYLSFSPADEDKSVGNRNWGLWVLALLFYVAALLSKTVTCSLPASILLIYWWKRPRRNDTWAYVAWLDAALLIPFFAVGVALGLHTAYLEKTQVGANGTEWESIHFLERCLIAGNAIAFYAWKLIYPVDYTFIYPFPLRLISRGSPELYIAPVMVVVVLLTAFFLQSKITRGPFTALMFFVMTLFPALGFINVYPFRYSIVADHFQYLASIGFIAFSVACVTVLMSHLIQRLSDKFGESRHLLMGFTAGFLLILLAINSFVQSYNYRSLEMLWLDTIQKNPDCWLAHNNLGILYQNAGRDDLAKDHFAEAVRVSPDSFESLSNYGHILAAYGENELAMEQFQRSIQVDSRRPDAYLNTGEMMLTMGREAEAQPLLERALSLNQLVEQRRPGSTLAMYFEGRALMLMKRYDESIVVFKRIMAKEPDNAELYQLMGTCNLKADRTAAAAANLSQAVRVSHDNPLLRTIRTESMNLLSRIYAASREAVSADPALMQIIAQEMKDAGTELKEKNPAKYRLVLATDLATTACEIATKDSPHYSAYLDTLAIAHASAGRYTQAVEVAKAAADFARQLHMNKLADQIDVRRKLYEEDKPYVANGAALFQE